ncbi:oligosaccharide flippase family protein [Fundidesulfovibrio agrisoli]|uniref:oligosaccharide flippase family protein n=1 Tax=Fundidesulfovibrio agrisoli TaxID=2922717 RepID=UPI001FADB664|nr:oligosaccharide flippase family protein [Fundidesulfovibrio agrisoli]
MAIQQTCSRLAAALTVRNTAWLTMSSLVCKLLAYVQFVLVVRVFTGEEVGIYAVCITMVLFAEMAANLGLDRVVMREIARLGDQIEPEVFDNSLLIKLGASAISYSLCLGACAAFYPDIYGAYSWEFACFLLYIPAVALARSFESHFTALERMSIPAVGQLAERVAVLLTVMGAWLHWYGFGPFLALFPLAGLLRAAIPFGIYLPCRRCGALAVHGGHMRSLARQSSWMFAVELVAMAYFRVDIFLLSKLVDLRSTGMYQVAYKIFDFFIAMFSGYILAVFPAMARGGTRLRVSRLLLGSGAVLVLFALPVSAFGRQILGVFKPEYVDAAPALTCLMLALPLVYANSMFANFAVATAKIKVLFLIAVPMLGVNVGLNLVLIPHFNITGAALATLLSEVLLGAALLFALRPFAPTAGPTNNAEAVAT